MDLNFLLELLALFLTLSVLLYLLVGDNALFRIVIYTFIGVVSGYVASLVIFQVLIPRLAVLVFSGQSLLIGLAVVQLLLGLMLFFKLWKGTSAVGTLPVAILAGVGAAITIGGAIYGTLFQQVEGTIQLFDLSVGGDPLTRLIEGVFVLTGSISVLAYFHFGVRGRQADTGLEPRRPFFVEALGKVGSVFIGLTLGAMFAGVYTAALTALVERIGFVFDVAMRLTR